MLIGQSTLNVYPLSLGGNVFGWTADVAQSHAVLDAFVASGGDFVDTADVYSAWAPGNGGGESETVLGGWLAKRGRRDDIVLATKVSEHPDYRGLSRTNVAAAAEASLARLQTDYVDLYYAHFDDTTVPLEETAAAFDALVVTGKVRYLGLSNYSAARVAEWMAICDRDNLAKPVAVQPLYNLLERETYENELLPVIEANRLGAMPYLALASGMLTGKYRKLADLDGTARELRAGKYFTPEGLAVVAVLEQIATARGVSPATIAVSWLQRRPGVVAPIASARTVEQLEHLMAADGTDLDADETRLLDEASGSAAN
jgi:aryl-alcohol dehydrogenase-like predicted oxidoreductase